MATSKIRVWDPKTKQYIFKTVNVSKDDAVQRAKKVIDSVNTIVKPKATVGASVKPRETAKPQAKVGAAIGGTPKATTFVGAKAKAVNDLKKILAPITKKNTVIDNAAKLPGAVKFPSAVKTVKTNAPKANVWTESAKKTGSDAIIPSLANLVGKQTESKPKTISYGADPIATAAKNNIGKSGNAAEEIKNFGENVLQGIKAGGRNFLSAIIGNVGSYNEALGNVESGKKSTTYTEWAMNLFAGDDKEKAATQERNTQRLADLQAKKDSGQKFTFEDQYAYNLLSDTLSSGAVTEAAINKGQSINEAEQQALNDKYTGLSEEQKKAGQSFGGIIGGALPMVGLSAANPFVGMEYLYGSSAGESGADAIEKGADLQTANKAAALTGAANVATESLTGGLPFVKGIINLGDKAAANISNKFIKAGAKRLTDAFGEGMEEVLMTAVQPLINRATYDPDAPLATFAEYTQAFGSGYAAAVFLGVPYDVATMATSTKSNTQSVDVNASEATANTAADASVKAATGAPLIASIIGKEKMNAIIAEAPVNEKAVTPAVSGNGTIAEQGTVAPVNDSAEKYPTISNKIGADVLDNIRTEANTTQTDPAVQQEINPVANTTQTDKINVSEKYKELRDAKKELDALNIKIDDGTLTVEDGKRWTEVYDQVNKLDSELRAAPQVQTATQEPAAENTIPSDAEISGLDEGDLAWIMPNGETLYFSEISAVHQGVMLTAGLDKKSEYTKFGEITEDEAYRKGAMRVKEGEGVEVDPEAPPTEQQYKILNKFIERFTGNNFYVDMPMTDGIPHVLTYTGAEIDPRKIITDIKREASKISAQKTEIVKPQTSADLKTDNWAYTDERGNKIPLPIPEMQTPPDMVNDDLADIVPALPETATPEEVGNFTRSKVMTESPSTQKPTVKEKVSAAWDAFQRKIIDSAHTIDTLGKKAGDTKLYKILNNARQSKQAGEFMLGLSITGQKTYQANYKGQKVGESLADIWKPIKAKGKAYYREFQDYLLNVHNIDRMSVYENAKNKLNQFRQDNPSIVGIPEADLKRLSKGGTDEAAIYGEYLQLMDTVVKAKDKPVFGYDVTADQSKGMAQLYESKYPEFKDLAAKVYKYNDNLLTYRVDTGLLSQESADFFRAQYPHYVPVYRNTSVLVVEEAENSNPTETDKRFAPKNENKVKVAQTVKNATGGDTPVLPIDDSMTTQTLQVVKAAKLNQIGTRLLGIMGKEGTGEYLKTSKSENIQYDIEYPAETLFKQQEREGMENKFVVFENGQSKTITVNDGIFEGLEALTSTKKGPGWAIAGNNMYKKLITGYNPIFIPRNFLKDIQDAGLYTKNAGLFIKNYPKAWKEMISNGKLWQQYQALGGFNSSFFDYDKKLDSEHSALQRWTVDKIETANMMIEQGPRFAEFMATVEKGGDSYENLMQAMYDAADITVNFGRSGSWGKTINSTFVPFFNPSVQGFDKLIRRFTETKGTKEWTSLVIRAAVLGIIPSLLNALLHDDDDEYKVIDDRTKDTYYLFKLGSGVWAKIPKGRVLSLFGSGAQRIWRAAQGEEGAFAGFIETMADQVSPISPFTNNILSPVLSVMNNKNWYGGSIESEAMQNLRPEDRYDQSTDVISKWLGKLFGQSPKKINYLIDAYSGVLGDFLLPLTTPQAEQNPFVKAFTIDAVTSNRISDDFYDLKTDLTYQESEEIESDVPTITDLALRYVNKQGSIASDFYKEIKDIQNSNLTDDEKQSKVRDIRILINGVQQTALQGSAEMQTALEKYYAEVDTSLSVEEQARQAEIAYTKATNEVFGSEAALKTVGGTTYENAQEVTGKGTSYESYYNFYMGTRTTDGEQMPEKEKTEVLLNLDVSEKDIEIIFANAFEDTKTQANKSISYAVQNGVAASTFAAYKTQDFTGEGGTTRERQWIFDNSSTPEEMATLYQMKEEDKDTKEENSIAYAMAQGVSPAAFIQRTLQAAAEEGDKTVGTDVTLTGGQAVTTAGTDTVSGTAKRESMTNLLTSGYTEEEKLYFYQRENPDDDKFVWAMVAGIPTDEYLTLQRDTWSIKGTDTNGDGKTDTGSKKAAYSAYLDTLKLDDAQKGLLMIQNGYAVDSSVKSAVMEYINGLGLADADKTSLLASLKLTSGSGGGGSGGKAKKAKLPSINAGAKASIKSTVSMPSLNLPSAKAATISQSNINLKNMLDAIRGIVTGGQSNIISTALQQELANVDNNTLLTATQKAKRKQDIRKRYE